MIVNHQLPAVEETGFPPKPLRAIGRLRQGFSLIEICIALGIVAFAFVALLGLLPVGLGNYTQAMNTQTSTEIYQRIAAELQETEFDTLLSSNTQKEVGGTNAMFFRMAYRYFDTEGQEVKVGDSENPTETEKNRIIYTVRTRGSFPGKGDPKQHTSSWFTSLPAVTGTRFNPRDVMFFSIQVALTQGREVKSLVSSTDFIIDPTKAAKAGVGLRTYSILVARNGYDLTIKP
jgi:uncharacterized protein (TIGR02598 family)